MLRRSKQATRNKDQATMQVRKKKSHKPTLAEEFERGIIPRKEFDKKKTQLSQQKPTLGCMYNVEVTPKTNEVT